jgi:hypothetical protein
LFFKVDRPSFDRNVAGRKIGRILLSRRYPLTRRLVGAGRGKKTFNVQLKEAAAAFSPLKRWTLENVERWTFS